MDRQWQRTKTRLPPPPTQQDVAQDSDAKAEATSTASDELSEDDLGAVAGGGGYSKGDAWGRSNWPAPLRVLLPEAWLLSLMEDY